MKKPLLYQFDLHQQLYNNVLDGFTDVESNRRLHKNMNHVKYLAGHILNSQYGLGILAGADLDIKWHDMFAVMGQSKAKDDFPYPTIEEIRAEWNTIYPPLRKQLDDLSPKNLNSKPPEPFDQIGDSVAEVWTFINHHTAYHLGQIGILRRGFDKEPMKYS
ncbi:MAG: DinB family protein [Balneolaceae bacterium]|nr:DinB family protein [Balneolaceae bacterium]